MTIEEQVFRFQVTVDNVVAVEVIQCERNLGGVKLSNGIRETLTEEKRIC